MCLFFPIFVEKGRGRECQTGNFIGVALHNHVVCGLKVLCGGGKRRRVCSRKDHMEF